MIQNLSRDRETLRRLLEIWESAVRATHDFLTEAKIQELKPQVETALMEVETLTGLVEEDEIQGFLGVDGSKIEMLFVDAQIRGKGIGKKLIRYAIDQLQCNLVDVNEQNPQGVGFYRHMGFEQVSRSERDEQGNPFPILHMQLKG